jgi:hypothetical protein
MAKKKKLAIGALVIGICNLVYGLPCICCIGLGAVGTAMGPQAGANQANNPFGQFGARMEKQQAFMQKEVPSYKPVQIILAVSFVVYGLCLVVAAFGLFFTMSFGRYLSIIASAVMILLTLIHLVHAVVLVVPAANKFVQQEQQGPAQARQAGFAAGSAASLGFDFLLGVGYPVVVIAVLLTPGVRQSFAGHRSRGDDREPDEFDDYNSRNEDDFEDQPDDRFR